MSTSGPPTRGSRGVAPRSPSPGCSSRSATSALPPCRAWLRFWTGTAGNAGCVCRRTRPRCAARCSRWPGWTAGGPPAPGGCARLVGGASAARRPEPRRARRPDRSAGCGVRADALHLLAVRGPAAHAGADLPGDPGARGTARAAGRLRTGALDLSPPATGDRQTVAPGDVLRHFALLRISAPAITAALSPSWHDSSRSCTRCRPGCCTTTTSCATRSPLSPAFRNGWAVPEPPVGALRGVAQLDSRGAEPVPEAVGGAPRPLRARLVAQLDERLDEGYQRLARVAHAGRRHLAEAHEHAAIVSTRGAPLMPGLRPGDRRPRRGRRARGAAGRGLEPTVLVEQVRELVQPAVPYPEGAGRVVAVRPASSGRPFSSSSTRRPCAAAACAALNPALPPPTCDTRRYTARDRRSEGGRWTNLATIALVWATLRPP